MTTEEPLTNTHRIIAITAVMFAAIACAPLVSWHPMPYIVVGMLMFGVSFVFTSDGTRERSLSKQKGTDMELLTSWDEPQVRMSVRAIATNRGSAAAMSYLQGVLDRFVYNQDALTYQKRSAFVKTQIEYVETITKLEVVKREAERTSRQEDIKDSRLHIQEEDVSHELELGGLRHELEKENLRRQIEELRHSRSGIVNEPPRSSNPRPDPVAEELRSQRKSTLEARKKQLLDAIRRVKAGTEPDEEQKQQTLTAFYEELASIEEKLIELL